VALFYIAGGAIGLSGNEDVIFAILALRQFMSLVCIKTTFKPKRNKSMVSKLLITKHG